jgi:hypothetical protein
MTMPALSDPSKPRRRGLWIPYILAAAGLIAWSAYWIVLKGQVESRMDRQAEQMRRDGYEVAWSKRTVGGYPFRFEMELHDVRFKEPSGWGVSSGRFKAMAAAYQPDHWVFVAPEPLRLSRPGAGEIDVGAEVLRASLTNLRSAPRLSLEGRGLRFTPQPGATPFSFTSIKVLQLHLRPGDGDRADLFWGLEGAETQRAGALARIAPLAPVTLRVTATLSKRQAFGGGDWRQAVRAWTAAGGEATVQEMTLAIGEAAATARGGPLTVSEDGRLEGGLDVSLRNGAAPLTALGVGQLSGSGLRLGFVGGKAVIGPVQIAPAPRIY